MFIGHIWSQQVYELMAYLRSANQNARNPICLVQFLIIRDIYYARAARIGIVGGYFKLKQKDFVLSFVLFRKKMVENSEVHLAKAV